MVRPLLHVTVLGLLAAAFAGCLSGDDAQPAASNEEAPAPEPLPSDPTLGGIWTGDERAIGLMPIDLIFGGSLRHALTRVLLVPPTHGDLGNPVDGPTVVDYLDATMRGIKMWEPIIDEFIAKYPQYSYLDNVTVEVEVFDQSVPSAAGYDVIIGYLETSGPAFRGVATQAPPDTQALIDGAGLGDLIHYANRYILLSLFASAPRAGQDLPDYPEVNDLQTVVMHEFAHTWGLGHTTTWTERFGPDLMNSPYALIYGDGNPVGDGEERSHLLCHSSLDMEGLAHLYRWMPNETWEGSGGSKGLTLPYEWLCPDGHEPPGNYTAVTKQDGHVHAEDAHPMVWIGGEGFEGAVRLH